jgi:hypothetical protein
MINLREKICPPCAKGDDLRFVHRRLTIILEANVSLRMLVLNGRIGPEGRNVGGVDGTLCGCSKSKLAFYP